MSLPGLPVAVGTAGSVYIEQNVESINSAEYITSFATYFRPPSARQISGIIEVVLGNFTELSTVPIASTASADLDPSFDIAVAVSSEEIYFDDPRVTIALQISHESLSIDFETEATIKLFNSSGHYDNYTCLTTTPSGICTREIQIANSWFLSNENATVMIIVDIPEAESEWMGSLTLAATHPPSLNNTIYINLPRRSVQAGEVLEVEVFASYNHLLLGFSFDCVLSGPAIVKDASASFEWGLLPDFFNASMKQIAVTGFRNYNKSNISDTGMKADHLFNLTISINEDAPPSSVSVLCDADKLTLTTGMDLPPLKPIDAIDRTGVNCSLCSISISHSEPIKLFAYAPEFELLNVAPLTQQDIEVPLHVSLLYTNGSLLPVLATCTSQNTDVIQVYSNCSAVYFSGNESSGADAVDISISYGNLNTNIRFKVWYSDVVSILVEDDELNAIYCVSDSIYQQTPVSITANIFAGSELNQRQILLTDQLIDRVISSNDSIATVSDGHIQGLREGVVNISLTNSPSMFVEVAVSNVQVCPTLNIFAFSGISLQVTDNGPSQELHISLLQHFNRVGSLMYLVAIATYSDGYSAEISNLINFEVANESVVGNVYEISNPQTEYNITAVWSCMDKYVTTTIESALTPPQLNISTSVTRLAPVDDVAAITYDIPTELVLGDTLNVQLLYPEDIAVSVSDHSALSFQFTPEDALQRLEGGRFIVDPNSDADRVEIRAHFQMELNVSISVEIVRTVGFSMTAIDPSTNNSVREIGKIGLSGAFQTALLSASAFFNDGTEKVITSMVVITVLESGDELIDIELSTNHTIEVTMLNVSLLNVTFQGNISQEFSDSLTILVTNNIVGVESIDRIVLSESGTDNEIYLDCVVTLQDKTRLDHTFRNGSPMYPDLIHFNTSDTEYIELVGGIIHVTRNSLDLVTVIAYSGTAKATNITFYSNLLPRRGEIDIGSNTLTAKPLSDTLQGASFSVPIFLNSNESVGVYELSLSYEPANALELIGAVQGKNWRNGSLIFIGREGVVTISGVLVSGAEGKSIELAILDFMTQAQHSGNVNMSVQTSFVSDASVALEDISHFATSQASEVQLTVLPSSSSTRQRRNVDEMATRSRRQANTDLSRDYNGDGQVDQRDAYILQVYLASQVYNFTSTRGRQVSDAARGDISDAGFNQIIDIEKDSLDISFTVTNISYRYTLDSSHQCMQEISGTLENLNGEASDGTGFVHVLLSFSSDNSSFQTDFNNANFTGVQELGLEERILQVNLYESDNRTVFDVRGNPFVIQQFEVEIIVITDLGVQADSIVDQIGGLYSEVVRSLNYSSVQNLCDLPTTQPPTTEAPTTQAPTTEELTTQAPTTDAPTTQGPTTEAPTTQAPTTQAPTTQAPTTQAPTTQAPTTQAPTTQAPTTQAPTTQAPTTEAPTTEAPTTEAPTTEAPTTEAPTTEAPTTEAPTTEAPTTEAPTTEAPTTQAPTTQAPTTEAPTTEAPTTQAPTTQAPTTEAPTTQGPTTEAPTTEAPTTQAPTTEAPTTEAPTTQAPTTEAPTTQAPTTEAPTTEAPTTEAPTTEAPTTQAPTTQAPTTEAPTTQAPTTEAPTTEAPTTQAPTTEAPTTQAPTTEAPTTQATTTQAPTTEAPTTEAPTTQAPTTEAPTTQAPTTEALTTQAPTTQAPTTQAPTTEAPTTQAPTTEASMTQAPTTEAPTTEAPTTQAPTTETPTTQASSTETPTTQASSTEASTAQAPIAQTSMTTAKETEETGSSTTQNTTSTVTDEVTDGNSGSSTSGALFGTLAGIAVVLIVVIIVILLIWGMKRNRKKKGTYRPHYPRAATRTPTHDFWFGEEEKIVSFNYSTHKHSPQFHI